MNGFKKNITKHPVLFGFIFPIVWFFAAIIFAGISSNLFQLSFDSVFPVSIGRIIVTIILFLILWKMNWLRATGITRLGNWQGWIVTVVALVYFSGASLYSFYHRISFDIAALFNTPAARSVILATFTAGFSEEILYRGMILYSLIRVWGNRPRGLLMSATLTSFVFAVIHLTQILTHGLSAASSLLLLFETMVIGFWWAALVIKWRSIWPAILTHFITNLVIAIQSLSTPIESGVAAYIMLAAFSLPPGVVGAWLIWKSPVRSVVPDVP